MCVFTCILNFTVSKTTKENGVYGEFKSNHNNNHHHLMQLYIQWRQDFQYSLCCTKWTNRYIPKTERHIIFQ